MVDVYESKYVKDMFATLTYNFNLNPKKVAIGMPIK